MCCGSLTHPKASSFISCSTLIYRRMETRAVMICGYGKENLFVLYLLSDDIWVVAGLNFKCTVVGP